PLRRTEARVKTPQPKQSAPRGRANCPPPHDPPPRKRGGRDRRNRRRMTKGNRQEREPDRAALLPVDPQRDREQPPHTRVQTVKCAEPGNREPWPELEGSRHAITRFLVKDSSKSPMSSRRPRAAPDAADAGPAI